VVSSPCFSNVKPFVGPYFWGRADHGYKAAVPAGFDAQIAEAGLVAVERHTLHKAANVWFRWAAPLVVAAGWHRGKRLYQKVCRPNMAEAWGVDDDYFLPKLVDEAP